MSAFPDPLQIYRDSLPELLPFIVALSLASVVIIASSSFSNAKKIGFQSAAFGLGLAVALGYLLQSDPERLQTLWAAFSQLTVAERFCVAVIAIGSTYFGGAMYIAPPEAVSNAVDLLQTPASVDKSIGFVVPDNLAEDDLTFFTGFFEKLTAEIVQDLPTIYEMPEEAVKWVDRMIHYSAAGGKMNRGLSLVSVQKTLARSMNEPLTPKKRCQAAALGWCVEFLQAFFLVADDIMDGSVTRRGEPCWYRREEVKMIAINDSFILESCVYKILKRYFGDESYYPQLVDLFIEVTRQTELGQLLDLTSQKLEGPIDLNRFTIERYTSIVKYKTAFYSFYLPVALGMIVSGISDAKLYDTAREILLIMGEYFQIQDDFLDCYGSPEVIGKIGTDIQDNKCSWLVVKALGVATPAQRAVLEENYGQHDTAKVERVKKLYEEMDVKKIFTDYEEESYAQIQKLLNQATELPREVFEFLLKKIYKRSK